MENLHSNWNRLELLKNAEKLLRIGTWAYDVPNDNLFWSDGMYNLLNVNPISEQISLNTCVNSYIGSEYQESFLSFIREGIEAEKEVISYSYELTIRGKICHIRLTGRKVRNEKNEVVQILGTLQDLSKEKSIQTELERSNKELKLSNEKLEAFSYVVSHDLKAPLRIVSNFLSLIKKTAHNGSQEVIEYFTFIDNSIKNMKKTIDALLKYAVAAYKNIEIKSIDIGKLIKDVLLSLNLPTQNVQIKIEFEKLPKKIYADPILVKLLIQNLISNALKYNDKVLKIISIDFEETNDHFVFHISDNGNGIESSDLEVIFTPFVRSTSKNITGSGIGLSTCKEIVGLHNGDITVTSKINEGSTFSFTISKKIDIETSKRK